jgi:hypothetical protein
MGKLMMYLLESSAVLAFFYLIYVLLLRTEIFFNLNRFFLIGILAFSLSYPLLSFEVVTTNDSAAARSIDEISKFRMSYYEAMASWDLEYYSHVIPTDEKSSDFNISSFDWGKLFFQVSSFVYFLGVTVCLSRMGWTLYCLRSLIMLYPNKKMQGVTIVSMPNPIAPFSFFKYVSVYEGMIGSPEFYQILAHEKVHIQQRHSIDLIIVQLLAAFFWFNPAIWQLSKSLKSTHEYIADKEIISSGYSLVEYQTLLLKQLISNNSLGLVHNFNLSFIKKRITMMKNKKSGWSGKLKVAASFVTALAAGLLIIQCNSKFEDSVSPGNETESSALRDFKNGVDLPVLPATGYSFQGEETDMLNFTISDNKLKINGRYYELNEIVPFIEQEGTPSIAGFTVLVIDKDQNMEFVRKVQTELRRADRRKILLVGQTSGGDKVETPLVLPRIPESLPTKEDKLIASGIIPVLKIDLGEKTGGENQKLVYDFVTSQVKKQATNYVVSAKFDNDDTYNNFLVNLVYIKEGFNQIYQERAKSMFSKDYYKVNETEHKAIREGVPMAISIAEGFEEGTIGSY